MSFIKKYKNTIKKRKKRGFTLIEVMVVIGMLVVLAGILLPKISGYVSEVRKFQVIEQARKVILAVESVNIKNPNLIKIDDINSPTINSILTLAGDLLTEKDVNKLNPTKNKVHHCYQIIESEEYIFTLDNNDCLDVVTKLNK